MKKTKSFGFTLIELLIVVSVIGILAGVLTAVINQVKARDRAQDGIRLSKIKTIAEAIETYRLIDTTRAYPTSTACSMTTTPKCQALVSDYINDFPSDFSYSISSGVFTLSVPNSKSSYYVYDSSQAKVMDCTGTTYTAATCTSLSGL